MKTFLWSELENKVKISDHVKFAAKNMQANFIACEPWVKSVVTFGMVLYRNGLFLVSLIHVEIIIMKGKLDFLEKY